MTFNIQGVIQAMARAAEETGAEREQRRKPVVTISRTMGSGGNEIANMLAERLGVECYSKEILDAVAKQAQTNKSLMTQLHESVSKASDAWLYAVVFGKKVTRDDYQHALVTTIRSLYRMGGVICGRGGHVVLAGRDIFRVRIIGSLEACARRVAMQEGIEFKDAIKRVKDSTRKRNLFIWEVFGHRVNDPTEYDLVINTDHFASYEQVVDILEYGVKSMLESGQTTGTVRK